MITKEQYLEAQKLIDNYNEQVNHTLIKEYVCICCKTNKITPISDYLDFNSQEKMMWNNGVIHKIVGNFGSKHDTDMYYVGICDECLDKLIEENLIVNLKDNRKILKQYYE